MGIGRGAVLAACILLFPVSHASADFYRWVDEDGKEFFTNDPAKIPQEYRKNSGAVEVHDDRVSVGQEPVASKKSPASSREHRDRHGRGEEYWRKKAANLRLKLRDQQDEYDLVLKQLEDQDRSPNRLSSRKRKTRTSLEKKKLKLEKDMAKTRRALEVDLPEDARRADAYPGWIRE